MNPIVEKTKEELAQENNQQMVDELLDIKNEMAGLTERREYIENYLPDMVAYENSDGTWTRFKKTDNIEKLTEDGSFWSMVKVNANQTEIKILKNKPKELK